MKVMISQPMQGKSHVHILEERERLVQMLENEGYEVVDSVIARKPPEDAKDALWYLGESLKVMATCDAVFFMPGWQEARGCRIEHAAADAYGLAIYTEASAGDHEFLIVED